MKNGIFRKRKCKKNTHMAIEMTLDPSPNTKIKDEMVMCEKE